MVVEEKCPKSSSLGIKNCMADFFLHFKEFLAPAMSDEKVSCQNYCYCFERNGFTAF